MGSEVAAKADFSGVRYAQCWEDADILVEGLEVQPGDVCLSIASAGDNSLALLTRNPSRVIALDLSYDEGSVAERILARAKPAVTELNPADNPYLQWIMTGRHTTALPLALRPEHFDTIRANLDRLEWHCQSIEDFLDTQDPKSID